MELSPPGNVDKNILRKHTKRVRVAFEQIQKADEALLRIKINSMLRTGQAIAEASIHGRPASNRDDVRIILNNIMINVVALETPKLVQQEFHGLVCDLSARGSCLGVPEYVKLQKGGEVLLTLSFLDPPLKLKGTVLGAR